MLESRDYLLVHLDRVAANRVRRVGPGTACIFPVHHQQAVVGRHVAQVWLVGTGAWDVWRILLDDTVPIGDCRKVEVLLVVLEGVLLQGAHLTWALLTSGLEGDDI